MADNGQKCDHGQLYAIVNVSIAVPIEHNSAIEVSRALNLVNNRLGTWQYAPTSPIDWFKASRVIGVTRDPSNSEHTVV